KYKIIPMKSILTIILLLVGGNIFAQLASEKPLNEVYKQPIRQKLDQPKENVSQAKQLPSVAPLPKQVTAASAKAHSNQAAGQDEQRKKLPSNAKRIPAVK